MPGAETHTGVRPAQDETPSSTPVDDVTPTSTTSTTPDAPATTEANAVTTTSPAAAPVSTDDPSPGTRGDGVPVWAWVVAVAAILLAAWALFLLVVPMMRRGREHGPGPAGRVVAAWTRSLTYTRWLSGLRPAPSETHVEFAARTGRTELGELAELATVADWGPSEVTETDAVRAASLADALGAAAAEQGSWFSRLRRRLSWREALQSSGSSPS